MVAAGWGFRGPLQSTALCSGGLKGLCSRKCTFPLSFALTHRRFQDPLNLSQVPKVKSSDLKTIYALDILGSFMKGWGRAADRQHQ